MKQISGTLKQFQPDSGYAILSKEYISSQINSVLFLLWKYPTIKPGSKEALQIWTDLWTAAQNHSKIQ